VAPHLLRPAGVEQGSELAVTESGLCWSPYPCLSVCRVVWHAYSRAAVLLICFWAIALHKHSELASLWCVMLVQAALAGY
jgi:hypothetical protein